MPRKATRLERAYKKLRAKAKGPGKGKLFVALSGAEPSPKKKRRRGNLNLVRASRTSPTVSNIYNWSERGGWPYGG